MNHGDPIRFGLTGMGGYAGETIQRLLAEAAQPNPRAALQIVCEPNPQKYPELAEQLRKFGIPVVTDFQQLLNDAYVDMAWLTLPIDLHRSYTEMSLNAGKPVLCEKPAAGSVDDVDAMIAARDRTGLITAVGYQDLYQPAVGELKRRIIRGEFGIVLSASVIGCWPRSAKYYHRNAWAGKIAREGRWVLDSPACNAMAHYINMALFLLGATERESATPTEVEAELYRANDIENYDTCSMRLTFENGVHLLLGMTHACQTSINPEIVIRTQFARIRFIHERQIEIHRTNVSEIIPLIRSRVASMWETLSRWLVAGEQTTVGATLETAKAHVVVINAASETAPIINLSPEFVHEFADEQGHPLRSIPGIETAMELSIRNGRMLHELSNLKWTRPASDLMLNNYSHFPGPANPEKRPGT